MYVCNDKIGKIAQNGPYWGENSHGLDGLSSGDLDDANASRLSYENRALRMIR